MSAQSDDVAKQRNHKRENAPMEIRQVMALEDIADSLEAIRFILQTLKR